MSSTNTRNLFVFAVMLLLTSNCSKSSTPVDTTPDSPCVEQIPFTEIDVSNAPPGKIVFSAMTDSILRDTLLTGDSTRTYVWTYSQYQLFMMNPDGSELEQMTHFDKEVHLLTLSPDGKKIVYSGWGDLGPGINTKFVYLFDRQDSTTTQLTDFPCEPTVFSWSPDGKKIAFSYCHDCEGFGGVNDELHLINLETGNIERLTFTDTPENIPHWSPDGQYLIFFANPDVIKGSKGDVYIMDVTSKGITRLTCSEEATFAPIWSPDGSRIAIEVASTIYEIPFEDLTKWREISTISINVGVVYRDWSPDGNYIVFFGGFSRYDVYRTIYKINVQTGAQEIVLKLPDSSIGHQIETVQWLAVK